MMEGTVGVKGDLSWVITRAKKASLGWKVRNQFRWNYIKGWLATFVFGPLANIFGVATILGELSAVYYGSDGRVINYGVLGRRVVTTAYCEFMVDQHQTESSVIGDYKFHDSGVGTTNEAAGDTDIETTDGESRATGTQTEGSSVAYQSVGTIAYTSTKAITEHGLFSASTGATLMDRTEFAVINVVNGDSIQFTYTITYTAGS
jgi:hypothetical protein